MRYSEAVKRYKLETKQKILARILEAAEREINKPSAGSVVYYDYNPATDTNYYDILGQKETETEEDTEKKETIIMKNSQLNEVRNRKAGFIAAACAALVIGGGAAVYASSMNGLELAPAASAANSETESVTTSAAAENAKPEDAAAEVTTSSGTDAVVAAVEQTSYEDLLASTEKVCAGKVLSAEPCYVHDVDGSTKYYIEYLIETPIVYIIESDSIIDHSSADITVYQPVPEGSAPQVKIGENAVFMISETKGVKEQSGEGKAEKEIFVDKPEDEILGSDAEFTESGGVFSFLDHRYYNTSKNSDEAMSKGLTDYVNSVVLSYKDEYSVYNWFDMLGEEFTVNDVKPTMLTVNDSSSLEGMVAGVHWNEKTQKYEIDVCRTPENELEQYMNGKGYVVSGKEQITNKITEGFDNVDITLDNVTYYPDSTALILELTISAKEGSGFEFHPDTFYRVNYSDESLQPLTWYFNADALISNNTAYSGSGRSMNYRIVLDQADDPENGGALDFDTAQTYKFTIDNIQIDNDTESLKGKYEASFKLDPEIVKNMPNARMITPDTPAINAEIIKNGLPS